MPVWAESMIAFLTGGGLLAVLGVVFEQRKKKSDEKKQNIDERINFWEKAAEKNEKSIEQLEMKYESRISALEQRIGLYEMNFQTLQNHISVLEHIILRIAPDTELPKRPEIIIDWKNAQKTGTE